MHRVALLLLAGCLAGPAAAAANPVSAENRHPGTRSWERDLNGIVPLLVEGYSTTTDAAPGDRVGVRVATARGQRYRIELVRLGWYGGRGARRIACFPGCSRDRPGIGRPRTPAPDPSTGRVEARWPVTDVIRVPRTAVSGYYLLRFVLTRGPYRGLSRAHPLIVRAPARRRTPIVVVVPVNTWQAYNAWGGRSLYDYNSVGGHAAVKVSFDRPYDSLDNIGRYEASLVRFLEREGRDVSYVTDADLARDPSALAGHRLVMAAGHGEYWTKEERDAYDAARDRGQNIAFMGSDVGSTQARYEDGGRTLVVYRSASADPIADPRLKTVKFRSLRPPRPPCELVGVEHSGLAHTGDRPRGYTVVAPASDRWMRGTGLTPGTYLPDLVGHEWDAVVPGCAVPAPTVLFHYAGATLADAVRYTAPSGATVFSAGSLRFVWGLDAWGARYNGATRRLADARLRRFMDNVLRQLAPSA